MIRYVLRCNRDHEFDAWFSSSAAYDRAAKAGGNACPMCGSAKVEKAIMAPSIGGRGGPAKEPATAAPSAAQPVPPTADQVTLATVDPRQKAFIAAVREFRQKVTANADYVGPRFAEEARKIDFEEVPARGIYGEATPEEARELADDGIAFQPLPPLPEGQN